MRRSSRLNPRKRPLARRSVVPLSSRRRARLAVVVPGVTRSSGFYGRFGPGGELKFLDNAFSTNPIANTGTIASNSLVVIPQGDGQSQRIGRKITVRSIYASFCLQIPATLNSDDSSDIVRIIIYWDKQTNGAAATPGEILAAGDVATQRNVLSYRNLENASRFRILKDKSYYLTTMAGIGSSGDVASVDAYKLVKMTFPKLYIPIEYSATADTGAIATIRSNNIGVLMLTRTANANVISNIRVRYSDN